jgi:hypothetical protein
MKQLPDYRIIEMWEHDWTSLRLTNAKLREWIAKQDIIEPINVRDCLAGGRTNANILHYKCKPDETIKYYDIRSLYPSVQKTKKFPVKHPKILTENFDTVDKYFGIIKCTILPPRNLLFPVLPVKINNKLVFTLCNHCAKTANTGICFHTENERALTHTWCTPELHKALSLGYKVLKIYEVYHYEETSQYDSETKTGGIFTDYINYALKTKEEASGYPPHVKTDQDKDKYIQEFYNQEGKLFRIIDFFKIFLNFFVI